MRFASVCLTCLLLALTGCTLSTTAPPTQVNGASISGKIRGGQQPVSGARVYLLAANTTGYGQPSISLLDPLVTLNAPDAIGSYVTTDSGGNFSLTGTYLCTPTQDVYIYSYGGNPGAGVNNSVGLMAALGPCTGGTFAVQYPFVQVNEVTTIAAAYALSGFATDSTHISSSGTTAALLGVNNAFLTAASLANIATGGPVSTTASGGTVNSMEIYTLANILAACINSDGSITGPSTPSPCYTLLNSARSGGATGNAAPDTATAAINIAHHPGANVAALFQLPTPGAPFAGALTAQPNDFSMAISYPIGGANLAIDTEANIWTTGSDSVFSMANDGTARSPAGGYTGGGVQANSFNVLSSIAIDQNDHVWVANTFAGIAELDNSGTALSSGQGITGGGISFPFSVDVDGFGNIWIADYGGAVSKLSSSGSPLSPGGGYTVNGNTNFNGLALDGAENIWVSGQNGLNKLFNCGAPTSSTVDCAPPPTSAATRCGLAISPSTPYTGGGLHASVALAIDANGSVWAANSSGTTTSNLSKLSNSGCPTSGPNGYAGATSPTAPSVNSLSIDGDGNAWFPTTTGVAVLSPVGVLLSPSNGYVSATINNPSGIGIDSSGNVWVTNNTTTEFVGAAAPVVTPLALAVQNNKLGARP
jgi:streptogramin lyase